MPSGTEPLLCRVAAGALPGLRSASCLAFPSPAGKGLPQALAPSSRATCSALRLSAAARQTLHLSHAGGAGDRRGHPFAADQPREATSAGFAPCSSATAAGIDNSHPVDSGTPILPRAGSAPDPTADGTYRLRTPRRAVVGHHPDIAADAEIAQRAFKGGAVVEVIFRLQHLPQASRPCAPPPAPRQLHRIEVRSPHRADFSGLLQAGRPPAFPPPGFADPASGRSRVDIIGIQATQRVVNRLLDPALLSPMAGGPDRSATLVQAMEGLQRFRHRGLRIRPVGEVEVDIIGIQATQRVVNRLLDPALLSPLWPGRPDRSRLW